MTKSSVSIFPSAQERMFSPRNTETVRAKPLIWYSLTLFTWLTFPCLEKRRLIYILAAIGWSGVTLPIVLLADANLTSLPKEKKIYQHFSSHSFLQEVKLPEDLISAPSSAPIFPFSIEGILVWALWEKTKAEISMQKEGYLGNNKGEEWRKEAGL